MITKGIKSPNMREKMEGTTCLYTRVLSMISLMVSLSLRTKNLARTDVAVPTDGTKRCSSTNRPLGVIVVCKSKRIIRETAQSSNTSNQNVVVGCVQRRNIGLGTKN